MKYTRLKLLGNGDKLIASGSRSTMEEVPVVIQEKATVLTSKRPKVNGISHHSLRRTPRFAHRRGGSSMNGFPSWPSYENSVARGKIGGALSAPW